MYGPTGSHLRIALVFAAGTFLLLATPRAGLATPAPGEASPSTTSLDDQGAPVVLPSGRLVTPAGRRYDLGDFPLGIALSPSGRLVVAPNAGQSMGTNMGFQSFCDVVRQAGNQCPYPLPISLIGNPDTPTPDESLSVVDLKDGATSNVTAVPTSYDHTHPRFNFFSTGVVFSPDGTRLYATGGGNDAVYEFTVRSSGLPQGSWNPRHGPFKPELPTEAGNDGPGPSLAIAPLSLATPPRTIVLPSTVTAGAVIPVIGETHGFTTGIAITPDGTQLLVVMEYEGSVNVIDTATFQLSSNPPIQIGKAYPVFSRGLYGVAVAPGGDRAFVTCERSGHLVALDRDGSHRWSKGKEVFVGDAPTGLAITPDGKQVLVALADDDALAVVDSRTLTVVQTLRLRALPGETWGSVPNAVAIDAKGTTAYVALGGDNAVAVVVRDGASWGVGGFVPTGWYPTAVAVHPATGEVLVVSAKGLGTSYLPEGPYPVPPGNPGVLPTSFYYDTNNMPGLLTVFPPPTPDQLESFTMAVRTNILSGADPGPRTAHNPVPANAGDPSPIKHVIYIVRENRTFDQVLGDLGKTRKDVDADPAFEILAAATPNAHAFTRRFAFADHFFSNGEASIQGHWWTTGAMVNDYTEKSWRQQENYSPRFRANDYVFDVANPRGCSIFQQAMDKKKTTGGLFTYRDYGEMIGAIQLTITDYTGEAVHPCETLPWDEVLLIAAWRPDALEMDDRIRAGWFLGDIGIKPDGTADPSHLDRSLSTFSYLWMSGDHTLGYVPGVGTPRGLVAQNDAGVGMVVQAISKSKYWKDTAIFIVEDDSQDGVDHVDGHRNILFVISPYAKRAMPEGTPGYVGKRPYSQASVLRTIELILGLQPMSAFDQYAPPLYDLFQDVDDPSNLTPADLASFDRQAEPPFIDEKAPAKEVAGPLALQLINQTKLLNLDKVDAAGPGLEAVLWLSLTDRPMPDELQRRLDRAPAAGRNAGGRQPEP